MKKNKNRITTLLLALVFLAGLSLLLYPTVSDYWNSFHASRAVAAYAQEVADLNGEEYDRLLAAARDYNARVAQRSNTFALTEEEAAEYQSLLNMDGTGIMGYIEIPNIKLSLPIYHGTEESVLQIAVGHLDWSALPVGGEGTHCVLSGHRGLPSAKLFTNLDQLREGDTFTLRVLDEVLCYEVDQIRVVEPQDTDALLPEPGQDLCTLVTCTPYGVNTHRLLVRGHRIENPDSADAIRVTSDAMQIEPILVAPAVGVPLALLAVAALLLSDRRRKRKN
ncbi:MAG: class C sortase [Dysosmobacter sp.]|nr:class C sortase [Dysosmobacter sp.]